jgi:hypothetical protein
MTSTSTIGTAQPPALARTVRDVIAHQPELVNEVWCRKIFRHILLALDRSHTLRVPHAPISPDTIGFDAAGDAILAPSAPAGEEPGEAQDIHALCAVVHHAITGEPQPVSPLRGRAAGYSEALVGAVDKCLFGDPAGRPQTTGELRNLLGIVALGPAVPSGAPPLMPDMPMQSRGGERWQGNWQRWLLVGLAAVVLLAAAAALVVLLRGGDAGDNVVLTLPEAVPPAKSLDPNEKLVHSPAHAPLPALPAATPPLAPSATTPAPAPVVAHDAGAAPVQATSAPAPAVALPPPAALPSRPAAQPATTAQQRPAPDREVTYKLMIKPWGTVYVDGDERGVSPPLKKLTLSPGRHTLRVVNPNYRDRVIRIEAGKRAAGRIDIDFSAPSR